MALTLDPSRLLAQLTALGEAALELTSGAGHDAQMMARIAPSAMIFVPSIKGISHNLKRPRTLQTSPSVQKCSWRSWKTAWPCPWEKRHDHRVFSESKGPAGALSQGTCGCALPAQGARYASWLAGWSRVPDDPTPLLSLPAQAERLGLGGLALKDEGRRSMLGSFKALGAPVALVAEVLRRHPVWEGHAVLAGCYADALAGFTVISATDGNHGRALAAAAQDAGCRCVIVLHAEVSEEREAAIAALGAEIVRVSGNYDASVAEAAQLADAEGWQVISDTSYAGYERIPGDVMQGYSRIAAEALKQGLENVTHVMLQGGVGGLAAGVVSEFWGRLGADRPTVLVVEPVQADCLLQSARQGRAATASGSVDSVMAGLACGEAPPWLGAFLKTALMPS